MSIPLLFCCSVPFWGSLVCGKGREEKGAARRDFARTAFAPTRSRPTPIIVVGIMVKETEAVKCSTRPQVAPSLPNSRVPSQMIRSARPPEPNSRLDALRELGVDQIGYTVSGVINSIVRHYDAGKATDPLGLAVLPTSGFLSPCVITSLRRQRRPNPQPAGGFEIV